MAVCTGATSMELTQNLEYLGWYMRETLWGDVWLNGSETLRWETTDVRNLLGSGSLCRSLHFLSVLGTQRRIRWLPSCGLRSSRVEHRRQPDDLLHHQERSAQLCTCTLVPAHVEAESGFAHLGGWSLCWRWKFSVVYIEKKFYSVWCCD
jgi:hypothetical protein